MKILTINKTKTMAQNKKFTKYKSSDFNLQISNESEDPHQEILDKVNEANPNTTYIIDEFGEDWVTMIDINDPQNLITFTED